MKPSQIRAWGGRLVRRLDPSRFVRRRRGTAKRSG